MKQASENPLGKVYLVGAGPGDRVRSPFVARSVSPRRNSCSTTTWSIPRRRAMRRPPRNVSASDIRPAAGSAPARDQSPHGGAARDGKNVVRLKSGDPFLFGRGAEEVEALTVAGIPYEVVPGVTAAFAVASHAGIPLTHRDLASAVALITGHRRGDGPARKWTTAVWPSSPARWFFIWA